MADTSDTMSKSEQDIETLGRILNDHDASLALRFRSLFGLKATKAAAANHQIEAALTHDLNSPLMKHECAYVLGQMKDPVSNPILTQVLENTKEDSMVRHEAGEALAAIGSQSSLPLLQKYSDDPDIVVAQTCQLGVEKLLFESSNPDKSFPSRYESEDPSPPIEDEQDAVKLGTILKDQSTPLFQRYRAMFALRNLGSPEAVHQLGKSLEHYMGDTKMALLKHEIAYVFGQMQDPLSVPYLGSILRDVTQSPMVRHEAAEALGSIASDDAHNLLVEFKSDPEQVVMESIKVALDMTEFENNKEMVLIEL